MSKRNSRRTRLNWFTRVLAGAAVVCMALISASERGTLRLPLISEVFGEAGEVMAGPSPEVLENSDLSVHFIDVGQGKAILVKAPEKNALIDAGENDQGQKVLKYLAAQGVERLDIAIGTHPHSDHIGGLDTVIAGIPVDTVILPVIPEAIVPTTVTYRDLLQAIADAGLKITPAKAGASYDLGGGARLAVLGPLNDYEDLNDMSVISRLSYGDVSFLFTGDATAAAERDMLEAEKDVSSDVLDVAHHGSSTSSAARFLAAVNPRVAVISCGLNNSYGHPHREIVERIDERGARLMRTDLMGTVVVSTDGKALELTTEK